MKKYLLSMAVCLMALFTPAKAQISGWAYVDSFPWVYLNDEESWAYLFVVDSNYWIYVMETGDYEYAGAATTDGLSPASITGTTQVFQIIDEDVRGTATLVYGENEVVTITVVIGDETETITGEYEYQRQGANTGFTVVQVEDEDEDVITDSMIFTLYTEAGAGYYSMLSFDDDNVPQAGDDGNYGVFTTLLEE